MAAASPSLLRLTEQEYLALDCENEFRSEFIDGEMIEMPGGSFRHSEIIVNCVVQLRANLDGKGFTVLSSNARVRTPSTGSYVYPDVVVISGPLLTPANNSDVLLNPTVIVEVLSPATKAFDRGIKFDRYREIDTLKEYLLLHSDAVTVEHYSRQADNSWIYRESKGSEAVIFVSALNTSLSATDLYASTISVPAQL